MRTRLRRSILATLACVPLLTVASCAEWQGTNDVSTDVGGGALGTGPGLITGKRGGIIIYNDVWSGAAPGGGIAE